jgi:signal transduction histidine kinase
MPDSRRRRRTGRKARAASTSARALASARGRLTRETGRRRVAQKALATNRSANRVRIEKGAVRLATAQGRLVRETDRRRVTQKALTSSEADLLAALDRSRSMEEELRQLSRSLLTSQEEERKRISRELHDALGQTLTGVNVGLASMRLAGAVDQKEFRRSVARTQRLVQKSMRTVHQFARHLRPALLDDLGLGPALHAFVRDFGKRNGLRASVSANGESAQLDGDRRTALFRVAQEALVNVGRHARARKVRVTLRRLASGMRLEVWNDGPPFDVNRALGSRTNRHLGLLCMRERMEMVGGTFSVRSTKKDGTTVQAHIPLPEEAA